jgi:Outer membrane protein beta-barrel domain
MKRIVCVAAFAAVVLGAPAFAANNANNAGNGGEIGFGVGQTSVSNSDATGVDSAQFLGLRGGYDINKQFQVEGQVASSSESGSVAGTSVDTTMRLYMVNGLYNFHPRNKEFVPYVMAGIGRADISVDGGGTTVSADSTAYQVGGGTRIFFGKSKTMAFRTDVSLLRETAFDSSTFTNITAGLTWRLGSH